MLIYLAGTMKTNWRSTLKIGCMSMDGTIKFLEPTPSSEVDLKLACWGLTDTILLDRSDMILAWLDAKGDNQKVCAEIGYAYAKGKPILLGMSTELDSMSFKLLRSWATFIVDDLNEAVAVLQELEKQLS